MALTDALSVACKALGVAADVYWQADKTKYTRDTEPPREKADEKLIAEFYKAGADKGRDKPIMAQWARQSMGNIPENLTKAQAPDRSNQGVVSSADERIYQRL